MRRYLEFSVAIIIIGILAIVLMRALDDARLSMEEASMQAEAQAIRSQLLEVVAHRETFGGRLPDSNNPLDWVANRPSSYLGAVDQMPEDKNVWYYDRTAGELVYRFSDGHRARFRLSRNAGTQGLRGVLGGIGLLRLEDIRE